MNSKVLFSVCAVLFFLIVSGCTTPYDLKRTKPLISYVSTRPAVEVKKCILKAWGKHHMDVFEEKISDGWLIRFNDTYPGATVAIVTIEGEAPEVKVNYHHRSQKIHSYRFEEDVNKCK